MAITEHDIGASWFTATADSVAPFIGGGINVGERIFLFVAWKDFSITAQITSPGTWTKVTEFADGSVSQGNGTGSMKVACWYHDWLGDGSETDPTVDFSSSPNIAGMAPLVLAKASNEEWDIAFATAGIGAATTWTATATSNPGIEGGDLVMGCVAFRDDSATMTRPGTTAIAATGITWAANHVERPATHLSTTAGNDMSADLGYRIAASGTASAAPTMTGTLSASETGAALFVRARVFVPKTYLDIPIGMAVGRDY